MYATKHYSRILKKLCHLSLISHQSLGREKAKREGTGERNIVRVRSHISRMESHICCCFLAMVPRRQKTKSALLMLAVNLVPIPTLLSLESYPPLFFAVLFLIDFQRPKAASHNLQGTKNLYRNPLSLKTIPRSSSTEKRTFPNQLHFYNNSPCRNIRDLFGSTSISQIRDTNQT